MKCFDESSNKFSEQATEQTSNLSATTCVASQDLRQDLHRLVFYIEGIINTHVTCEWKLKTEQISTVQKTNAVKHVNERSIMLRNESSQSKAAVMGSKAAYQAFTRQNNTDLGKITDASY